jgi:peptide/nickel transport system permease protein
MLGLICRRFFATIPLLLAVIVVNFAVIHLAPGDPIQALIGDYPAPPEYVEKLKHELGLDRSMPAQLGTYLEKVVQGDLGYSFANRRPVSELILERVKNTLLLVGTALTLASIAGILLGVSAARSRGSWTDRVTTLLSMIGFSVPVFWLAQILIVLFAVHFRWLPSNGIESTRDEFEGWRHVLDVAEHMILPVIALGMRYMVTTARLTRASVLEVLSSEYIVTAKAKGVSPRAVLYKHALPNALLPVATSIGHNFGYVLAGSALVETVFGWPGIGRLLYDSMSTRDTPVILGIFMVGAVVAVVANLATDIAYGFLDPRIRRGRK